MRKILWVQTKKKGGIELITPLAIPLQAGLSYAEMIDRTASVDFNMDGTKLPQKWDWISKKAGWLVYLPPGHALTKIDSGIYLFGSVSFWIFWKNGYQALCALDDNGDGKISGGELKNLGVWHDTNSNGRSDAGEADALASVGIVSLSCEHKTHPESGSVWSPNGVTFSDGSIRASYDLILRKH